ncbi:MAG: M15 family metallopeptidase [Chroococcales cyanobacterium]
MSNTELPDKASDRQTSLEDDIPEAVRETAEGNALPSKKPLWMIGSLLGLAAIALLTWIFLRNSNPESGVVYSVAPTPSPTPSQAPPSPAQQPEHLLGHLRYEEAPESDLKAITRDGRIRLRTAAADKFQEMQAAARRDGVILVPISGYRTVEEQKYLFFGIQQQRVQRPAKRAEVSAPPGYSEHHTGYTVDIGDGNVPGSNLSTSFENTAAFRWLEANAARYSFELSFPRNNHQGVNYEPWHWRFVGDIDSLETFYKGRNLTEPLQNEESNNLQE